MSLSSDEKHKKKILKEDLYNNLLMMMLQNKIQLLDDPEIFYNFKSVQYEYDLDPKAITKLKIFATPSADIVESLTRAAWANHDTRQKIWCR